MSECLLTAPRTVTGNVAFRAALLRQAQTDRKTQLAIIEACKRDPAFFIDTFCWLLETREEATW